MQILKIKLGLPFFDQDFGGVYANMPTLIKGPAKSGKSLLAVHFADNQIKSGECVTFLTQRNPESLLLDARGMGVDFHEALRSEQLRLLPYKSLVETDPTAPPKPWNPYDPLPMPGILEDFKNEMRESDCHFVIFDTVVPWLAVTPVENMPPTVGHFIETLGKLGLTSILLLPEPDSPAARQLVDKLEELCPIVIHQEERRDARFSMSVVKYQGNSSQPLPRDYRVEFVPGVGFSSNGGKGDARRRPMTIADRAEQEKALREAEAANSFKPVVQSHFFGGEAAPAPAPATPPAAAPSFAPHVPVAAPHPPAPAGMPHPPAPASAPAPHQVAPPQAAGSTGYRPFAQTFFLKQQPPAAGNQ